MTDANNTNDALVTAYVYGELSDAAKAAFETQMRDDPALAAEVDGLMAMRTLLDADAAFGEEAGLDVPPPHLFDAILKDEAIARSPMVKAAIAQRAAPDAGGLLSKLSTWFVGGGALVGAAAVVFFVVTQNGGANAVAEMERSPPASTSSAAPRSTADRAPPVKTAAKRRDFDSREEGTAQPHADPNASEPKAEMAKAKPKEARRGAKDLAVAKTPARKPRLRAGAEDKERRRLNQPLASTSGELANDGDGSASGLGFGGGGAFNTAGANTTGADTAGADTAGADTEKSGRKKKEDKAFENKGGLLDRLNGPGTVAGDESLAARPLGAAVANGVAEEYNDDAEADLDEDDFALAENERRSRSRQARPEPPRDAPEKKPATRRLGIGSVDTGAAKDAPVEKPLLAKEEKAGSGASAAAAQAPSSPPPPPPAPAVSGPPKLSSKTAEYARSQRSKLQKAASTKSVKKKSKNRTDFKQRAAREARLRETERTIMTAATELSAGRYASSLSLFERAESQGRGLSEIGLGPVLGQMQALTQLGRKADALALAKKGERAKRGGVAKEDVIAEGAKLATQLQNRVRARVLWRQLLKSKRFGREAKRALRALEFDDKMNAADAMEAPAPAVRQRR